MSAATTEPMRTRLAKTAGAALVMLATSLALAGPASAEFGIDAFTSDFVDTSGAPVSQAGSHADQVTFLGFHGTTDPSTGITVMDGQVRNIEVDLPAGFYGNPQALPSCTMAQLVELNGVCKPASQVGVLHYLTPDGSFQDFPVYSLKAPDSQTAVLGVVALSVPAKIVVSVRSGGDYGLTAKLSNLNQGLSLQLTTLTLWGVPADPIHDGQRYGTGGIFDTGHPAGVPLRPFLSMPSRCDPLTTTVRAASWQNPDDWKTASYTTASLTGCDRLKFDASIKARPQISTAGAPSGLDVRVTVPQDESLLGLATPTLRKAVVALPEGVRVSPASADGLGACSDADLKLRSEAEPSCPDSSKVGTVSIVTPVLEDPVVGDVILGEQRPDQLLRLFFVVRGPGLLLKLPGKVDPDPATGQLVATFADTPQLPFETLDVSFKGGPRASLTNPKQCGTYTTHGEFTPWSGGPTVEAEDSFTIDGNCDQAGRFEPTLEAGSIDAVAGGDTSFVATVDRPSGQQDISGMDVRLAEGLLADVDSVPLCPDAQAAAGACSPRSQVGKVIAAAGSGSNPLWVPEAGKTPTAVFLAGPYKGAPYSLSIVVPAQAGPFDLGTVVVRAALHVDPDDAHVTVKSDPLPTILQGIPLDVQTISVEVDRPKFMLNPTSCTTKEISAALTSTEGLTAEPTAPFQVGECSRLAFTPKLGLRLTGKSQMRSGGHPALRALLTQPSDQANIAKAKVTLPKNVVLDSKNAYDPKLVCDYEKSLQANCPASSIIGKANLDTPILDKPLTGAVHLVQGIRFGPTGNRIRTLPTLLVKLRGQVAINLRSKTSVDSKSRLVSTFPNVPDAPASRFSLQINGGKKGILTVTENRRGRINLCNAKQTALIQTDGQNGRSADYPSRVKTPCKR
jgi:hypothetical protein